MGILDEALGNEKSSILDEALSEEPQAAQPKEEGFFAGSINDMGEAIDKASNVFTGNVVLDNYNRAGALAGGVNKVIGRGLRSAYQAITPDSWQKNLSYVGNEIMQSPVGDALRGAGNLYNKFSAENPNASQFVESSANLASVVPVSYGLKGAKEAFKEGMNVLRDTKKVVSAVTDEGLQKGLSSTSSVVRNYSEKAQIVPNRVKSATDMKKFYDAEDTAVRQIIKDKDELVFADKNGTVIKKQLPETVDEWNQAIPQVKDKIMSRIENLIKKSGEKGGMVSTQPVLDTINTIKNSDLYKSMLLHKQYDDVVTKIDDMGVRYKNKVYMTPSEVNADIQVLNRLVGSQVDPLADIVIFDVLKTQRNSLDDLISNLNGKGFSDLKKTWGALKEIEPRVAQKANALSREEGRLNFWDIASLTEGGMGLVTMNPKVVAMAGATKLAKETVKWYNNPNRYVKNMFKKSEEKMNPDYESKLFNLRQAKRY